MKRSISWLLVGICCLTATSVTYAVTVAPTLQSKHGMVTAAHPLAAQAGAEILEKGGNAVDAAIAVSFALGVVEPYASGLGGEGYMVAVMADGREIAIDFRSTAPALAKTPIKGSYRGYQLSVPGSPVGGPRILATLNILEHFNLDIMDWDDPLAIHIMQEAMILTSLDQRRWLGDPETNSYIPEMGYVSKEYARQRM